MAHMLNKSRAWVMAHSDTVLFSDQLKNWQSLVSQLRLGVPLPYVLGRWEFFGMEFIVSPDVLIPRPETELLVENALDWINKPNMAIRSCVDVGTGSSLRVDIGRDHTARPFQAGEYGLNSDTGADIEDGISRSDQQVI